MHTETGCSGGVTGNFVEAWMTPTGEVRDRPGGLAIPALYPHLASALRFEPQ